MVADPLPKTDGDPRLTKAKSTLARFSPSGREARVRTMKKRAMITVLIGSMVSLIGLFLIVFFFGSVPIDISGSMAFLGVVMIGFGIIVWLTAR